MQSGATFHPILRLPIGANPRSKAIWDPAVKKLEKKLSSWERQYLSMRSRVILIKSTLSKLQVYYVSLQNANVSC